MTVHECFVDRHDEFLLVLVRAPRGFDRERVGNARLDKSGMREHSQRRIHTVEETSRVVTLLGQVNYLFLIEDLDVLKIYARV